MPEKFTSIRVKTTTRDAVNKLAEQRGIAAEDLIFSFTRTRPDTEKQILLNIDKEKFYMLRDLTIKLKEAGGLETDKLEDMIMMLIDGVIKNTVEKMSQSMGDMSTSEQISPDSQLVSPS